MSILQCKMCGGTLEINQSETVATCEYCGTQQTLPRLDNDKKINLYDRANHFRRNNEFDKAMGIYEQILNEDITDAETYWSLVLCRYGIEYVEDPSTHKMVPTVNRTQYTSIFDDDNYKSAIQYADLLQKAVYEEEAKVINEIQKGILAISQNEEPFDVFICYKETDHNGRRTPDSVLANDLYHQLVQEGFKVFFARITLEEKLGSAYEPYIFAALNSAKVMVVLGTKSEYFNAVWVKNEWSRYLSLIKNGAKKMLIPAYKDMDPYDMPDEFSHLQAQDMSKLGFMQDLIRGIKKILEVEEKISVTKEMSVKEGAINTNIDSLLKRAFMFLEDKDWKSADEYCEKVLDIEPECAQAYLCKLMAKLRIDKQEDLKEQRYRFDDEPTYQKVLRFGDEKLKNTLNAYIAYIEERNEKERIRIENERISNTYDLARKQMHRENTEESYKKAAKLFQTIKGYKESDALAEECFEKAETIRKDRILEKARKLMTSDECKELERAVKLLEELNGWKDAEELLKQCIDVKIPNIQTKDRSLTWAKSRMECKQYESALVELQKIRYWKNAGELLEQCHDALNEAERKVQEAKRKEETNKNNKKVLVIVGICFAAYIIMSLIAVMF